MHLQLHTARLRGFTLMELLVVIGIIVLLAGLSVAALSRSDAKAHRMQCSSNLRQLGISLQGFLSEHHVYPLHWNSDLPGGNYAEHGRSWVEALGGSRAGPSIYHCPSAYLGPQHARPAYGYNLWGSFFVGKWSDLGLGGHTVPTKGTANTSLAPPVHESEVSTPSDMMAVADSFSGGDILERHFWDYLKQMQADSRHQGKVNVLFCDGHVESPTLEFLFRDVSDAALVRWNRDHQPHREQLGP